MIRRTLRRLHHLLDRRAPAFYGQRLVLDPARRRAAARWLARWRPRSARLAPSAPADAAAAALERDGFHVLAAPLRASQLDDIVAHLARFMCRDPYRPELGAFDPTAAAPPATHVAFYPPEAVVSAPHVVALANDPFILATVERVFGCKPTIGYLAAWWSFQGHAEGEQAELFHRDVDDWRFLKLFVYLTDVDDAAGPHVYVPGSQAVPKLLRIGRYSDAAVTGAFGAEAMHRFEGARGTAFLEDTFGLHRGLPPRSRNRLILQVVYSLGELPYGPRRPYDARQLGPDALAQCVRDPYVNRVYLHAPSATR
ncbi:MAG: hypothetical protein HY060_17600 [Proteobacteria bacterium]|nr:hypothetical protein [Pseudomonadota bacterium]